MEEGGGERHGDVGVGTKLIPGAESQRQRHKVEDAVADGEQDLVGLIAGLKPLHGDHQCQHPFQDPGPGNCRNDR